MYLLLLFFLYFVIYIYINHAWYTRAYHNLRYILENQHELISNQWISRSHSLRKFSRRQTVRFFLSTQKMEFDITCKLSPLEKNCMKCLILFRGKTDKSSSKSSLLKLLPNLPNIKLNFRLICSANCRSFGGGMESDLGAHLYE